MSGDQRDFAQNGVAEPYDCQPKDQRDCHLKTPLFGSTV